MLAGKKDLMKLGLSGAGLAASNPLAVGMLPALAGLPLSAIGGAMLGQQHAMKRFSNIDEESTEDFVLPSDDVPEECWGDGGLRLGFTKDKGLPLDVKNGLLQRHKAIIGQSGMGKTTIIEYELFQQTVRGGGWLFIDAKLDKDTRNKLSYMASLCGREDDFYVLNVSEPDNSNTYNPILAGDPDEVASRILNLVPGTENSPGSDHYKQTAADALTNLIGAMKDAGVAYHVGDLAIMLQSDKPLGELLRRVPPGSARTQLEIFMNKYSKRVKDQTIIDIEKIKNDLGGMAGRIGHFAKGKFGQVFNTYAPEIDLYDIMTNNKMLYIMLPTMGKDNAALNLGKIILSDLRSAVARIQELPSAKRPNPPFLACLDEMGSYVMPGISRLFEQARSANISLVPAFQTFGNLNTVSPDFAEMIIGNTMTKIFFKVGSDDSANKAAELVGKKRKWVRSLSEGENSGLSSPMLSVAPRLNESAGGSVSEGYREEMGYRIEPDHFMRLGIGESIVLSGARVWHVKTPMLNWPSHIPEYRVVRHNAQIPDGLSPLGFLDRYREFMTNLED